MLSIHLKVTAGLVAVAVLIAVGSYTAGLPEVGGSSPAAITAGETAVKRKANFATIGIQEKAAGTGLPAPRVHHSSDNQGDADASLQSPAGPRAPGTAGPETDDAETMARSMVVAAVRSGAIVVERLAPEDQQIVQQILDENARRGSEAAYDNDVATSTTSSDGSAGDLSAEDALSVAEDRAYELAKLAIQNAQRQQELASEESTTDEAESFKCPDPANLPATWNNEYNRAVLRARGCSI